MRQIGQPGRPRVYERRVPVALTKEQLAGIRRYQALTGETQMGVLRLALDEFLLAEQKKAKRKRSRSW